jgi:predicted nucleotidyltransferase
LATTLQGQTTFTESAASWGINIGGSKDGGLAFGDYDNDGDLDLLVNTNDGTQRSRLYRRNSGNSYTDVTSTLAPNLLNNTRERSAVWGDVNNDGRLDFLRNASSAGLEIYIQGSNGKFGDGTGGTTPLTFNSSNIANGCNTEGAGFVDFDGDGDLDLIFDNHNFGVDILRNNYINHNTGAVVNPAASGLFTHATPGTTTILGLVQSATDGDYGSFTDVNDDGWVDIFMRKRDENDFFLNQGGTFTNGADLAEANNSNKGAVALYDFDNDGDFDAFWTENEDNQIFRNDGNGVWTPLGIASGIPISFSTSIDEVACGDIDDDGDVDILLVGDNKSFMYINQLNSPSGGVNTGTPMQFTLDASNSFNTSDGEGTVMVDIDSDGDLDIYMNISGGNQLWINNLYSSSTATGSKNVLFVEVLENRSEFMQTNKERPGLGATLVLLDCNGQVLSGIREVHGGGGHGTQDPTSVHFGLPLGGNYNYQVLVRFPNYQVGGTTVRKQVRRWVNPSELSGNTATISVKPEDPEVPCPTTLEICDNGTDDDGDGLIDCEDPDCGSTGTITNITVD